MLKKGIRLIVLAGLAGLLLGLSACTVREDTIKAEWRLLSTVGKATSPGINDYRYIFTNGSGTAYLKGEKVGDGFSYSLSGSLIIITGSNDCGIRADTYYVTLGSGIMQFRNKNYTSSVLYTFTQY